MDDKIEVPKPPPILTKLGKDKYLQIAEMLIKDGRWKAGDEIALSALCMNYERWIKAEKEIRRLKSLTFETETGYRQQIPEISIANNAMKTMHTFIKEFGLTPKQRKEIETAVSVEKIYDEELEDMIQ